MCASPSEVCNRVLVVAPTPDARLSAVLSETGAQARVVSSLAEATAAAGEDVFGAVLVALPGADPTGLVESATELRVAASPTPVGVMLPPDVSPTHALARGFAFALSEPASARDMGRRLNDAFALQLAPTRRESPIIFDYFRALKEHDWVGLAALCAPEVVYHLPAPGPFGRMIVGREAFAAYAAEVFQSFVDATFEPLVSYELSGGLATRYRGSWSDARGNRHRQAGAAHFRLRDDRIVRIGVEVDHERLGTLAADQATPGLTSTEPSAPLVARLDGLASQRGATARERSVLQLVVSGRTAAEIGLALGITPRTAKFHVANVLQKLGVKTRMELLRKLL